MSQKCCKFFINENLKIRIYFFTCILHNYVPHEIIKEFWKISHFENMTGGFLQRCQNLLGQITPEKMRKKSLKLPSNSCCSHLMYSVLYLEEITTLMRTLTNQKGNINFHELIFYWQIRLISCRNEFWHIRRKTAVIFPKQLFFKKSLMMSSAT